MNQMIFDKGLNDYSREFLVKGGTWPEPTELRYRVESERMYRSLGEQLLYHEGMAFKVYGESIPLAVLINAFGLKGFEALIEQKAMEFVLWTPVLTYAVTDVKGVFPLGSGINQTKVYFDPEESISMGLNWLKSKLDAKTKKDLIRKLKPLYKLPPNEFASRSAQFGHEGYRNNLFEPLGLRNLKPLDELNLSERKVLGTFATESLELAIAAHFGYGTVDEYNLSKICDKEYELVSQSKQVPNKTKAILKLEGVPNFNELIRIGAINLRDIPQHRIKSDAVKFRKMIREIKSDVNSTEFSREYIDVATKPGFFESGVGKYAKIITVSTLFGSVGGFLGGADGMAKGAILGVATQSIIDSSLGLLDGIFIDGLLKGWDARSYIHGLKKTQ